MPVGLSDVVAISALSGEGIDVLRGEVAKRLQTGSEVHRLKLSTSDGERIAWLHARGEVLDQRYEGDTMHVAVKLSPDQWARFQTL